jgi:hypothetical protein
MKLFRGSARELVILCRMSLRNSTFVPDVYVTTPLDRDDDVPSFWTDVEIISFQEYTEIFKLRRSSIVQPIELLDAINHHLRFSIKASRACCLSVAHAGF